MFNNKTILITGGTGSFGNAVLNRLIDSEYKEIRIFSRDEKKQHDMRTKFNNPKLQFFIGDVRNYDSINNACKNVDFVFQAAALKQVPSCEFFPMEATYTNIIGTDNVIRAAVNNNIKKIICLSTDKAAYPINAMGISKAMMEKVALSWSRKVEHNTIICVTRYGNVMASRGSVIPHFTEQIKNNKPLTITNPKMTRFLMSLDEAVELVFFAFKNGKQGDLFVQKSPASTIEDLSIAMKKLFSSDVETEIIGTRHGEKLYETLCTKEEMSKAEDLGNYYKVPIDSRDLNYNKYYDDGVLVEDFDEYNSHNTYRLKIDEIKNKLLEIDYIKKQLKL